MLNVHISWKYISEKFPWWGGFYERIIGIIKNCLKKVIWKPCLRYCEVETVLVEIEHTLNSRPLTYMSEENYAELLLITYCMDVTSIERAAILTIL